MKPTVPLAVSQRPVDDKSIVDWVNREAVPLAKQMRDALNSESVSSHKLTTAATGAFETIWESGDLPTDSAWLVEARIIGRSTSQTAAYILRATFDNRAGVVTQRGSTASEYGEETAAACDARMLLSGSEIHLDVRDDGASRFYWRATVRVLASMEQ